jgi:hypothetical protein
MAGIGLIVSVSAFAQKDLKSQVVGVYSLASIYDQMPDGKKNDTWGEGVEGSAILTSSGMFSVQILAANRHNSSTQGPRDPVGPIVTYYGTYAVDEAAKTVTYHIKGSSFPAWNGLDRKVTVDSVTSTGMDISAVVKGDPKMGEFVSHLKWKREGAS